MSSFVHICTYTKHPYSAKHFALVNCRPVTSKHLKFCLKGGKDYLLPEITQVPGGPCHHLHNQHYVTLCVENIRRREGWRAHRWHTLADLDFAESLEAALNSFGNCCNEGNMFYQTPPFSVVLKSGNISNG